MKINFDLSTKDLLPLPSAQQLESSVLGCVINFPNILNKVYKYLDIEGVFYNELNKRLWNSIKSIYLKNGIPDIANVTIEGNKISDKDFILQIALCIQNACDCSDIDYKCLKLIEFAIRRHCIRLGYEINQRAINGDEDPLTTLSMAASDIDCLYQKMNSFNETTMDDTAIEVIEILHKISDSKDGIMGLHGSINRLNKIIAGYRKGNLIILSASPGEGKTTFALQECLFMAEHNHPVGYITLEMPASELMLKMSCIKNNFNINDVVKGQFSNEDGLRIADAMDNIKKLPIYFCDKSGMKISEVKAQVRIWAKTKKIECIFIDLMHLIVHDDPSKGNEDKFSDIANQLKYLAKEIDIPIVSMAHLARKEKGTMRMHHMTDLKYSGGIEGAADVVLFIYRPEIHGEKDEEGKDPSHAHYSLRGKAKIYTGKIRLVMGGSVDCEFDGNTFRDVSNIPSYNNFRFNNIF